MQKPLQSPPIQASLLDALDQLRVFVDSISSLQFSEATRGASSIGAHARHCINHFEELLKSSTAGIADYDSRLRGTEIETDRIACLKRIAEIKVALLALPAAAYLRPIVVDAISDMSGQRTKLESTFAREAHYVGAHAVHHLALMRTLVANLAAPSHKLGRAYSTRLHDQESP